MALLNLEQCHNTESNDDEDDDDNNNLLVRSNGYKTYRLPPSCVHVHFSSMTSVHNKPPWAVIASWLNWVTMIQFFVCDQACVHQRKAACQRLAWHRK